MALREGPGCPDLRPPGLPLLQGRGAPPRLYTEALQEKMQRGFLAQKLQQYKRWVENYRGTSCAWLSSRHLGAGLFVERAYCKSFKLQKGRCESLLVVFPELSIWPGGRGVLTQASGAVLIHPNSTPDYALPRHPGIAQTTLWASSCRAAQRPASPSHVLLHPAHHVPQPSSPS